MSSNDDSHFDSTPECIQSEASGIIGNLLTYNIGSFSSRQNSFQQNALAQAPPYHHGADKGARQSSLTDSDSDLFTILHGDVIGGLQGSDQLREFYKKLIKTDAQIQNLKKNNELSLKNMDRIEDNYKSYPDRAKRSLKIFHKPLKLFHFRRNKKGKFKEENEIIDEKNQINKDNNKNKEDTKVAVNKDTKLKNLNARNKRFDNTTEPETYLIEKKNVLIQYKPKHTNRKSKCSHAPKDSKSHENQLKHPFYQNSQRLDELLDKFLDKNLPDIMSDKFVFDMMFEKEKKCKHPKIEVITNEKSPPENFFINNEKAVTDTKEEFKTNGFSNEESHFNKHEFKNSNINKNKDTGSKKDEFRNNNAFKNIANDFTKVLETTTERSDIFADLEFSDRDRKRDDTTTNDYGLLMSVSTLMYAGSNNFKRTTYNPLIERVPNVRKLLQTDADDDMNEVMVDSAHDDADKEERKKWMQEPTLEDMNNKLKMNPASILNPNWKGPMPLYPDELSSMIKQEPIIVSRVETPVHSKYNSDTDEALTANKVESNEHRKGVSESDESLDDSVETPVNSRDSPSEADEFETDLNDMEYIEDYFRNKYDRLVEMAQAYSDYGVLEGKKTTDKKMIDKFKLDGPDHSIKLAISGLKEGFKNSIFKRPKKGSQETVSPSEGFRLEIQPTSATREDDPIEFYKTLQKHIKIANFKQKPSVPNYSSEVDTNLIYTPSIDDIKTTKKFAIDDNELNMYSDGKGRRSLKSVEFIENDALKETPDENKDGTIYYEQNFRNVFDSINLKHKREVGNSLLSEDNNVNSKDMKSAIVDTFTKNSTENGANDEPSRNNKLAGTHPVLNNNTDMNLSDFFMLLSNWFSALDGVDVSVNHSLVQYSSAPNQTKPIEINSNKTVELIYPVYDSDMIENIGHRSRVLLAVEDVNVTDKVEDKGVKGGRAEVNENKDLKITNKTIDLTPKTTNIEENKTKTIVKRNADESNLIFWNDLYDDEYGVPDHFETNVRDTHSVASNDFIKRPNKWFNEKVRKIADGFHRRAENLRKGHKNSDTVKSEKNNDKEAKIKSKSKDAIYRRISRNVEDNGEAKKTDFAALTTNMKKVCRKAASDIKLGLTSSEREVGKDGHVATSLMQQLVRLMGDLVDYQVKQRTCRRLPEDLQYFLEWLTSPSSELDSSKYSSGYKNEGYPEIDFGKMNDKPDEEHNQDMASSSERDNQVDTRSDCLGTLQSVQALMRQYEDLVDDDKSKMSGVKEYLENQLQYLQRQLSSIHDYGLYNLDSLRFRRDITSVTPRNKHNKKRKRRFKQLISRFMKKIGRKHHDKHPDAKTIISNDKNINNSEASRNEVKKVSNEKVDKDCTNADSSRTVKEKRNLRDVYYKAIADAKKLTTVKNHVN